MPAPPLVSRLILSGPKLFVLTWGFLFNVEFIYKGDGPFCGFFAVLFKRDARKGRAIAMGNDSVGSDLKMYDCDENRYRGKREKCLVGIILGRFSDEREIATESIRFQI